MKRASVSFLAIITLVGLVFGGFLISSPNESTNPEAVNTDLLYRSDSPVSGNESAPIKIAVFSDYLCPYCKDAHEVINNILSKNGEEVAVYYRNLIVHESADILARAALAADKQGKFKEFDNILFERSVESTEDALTAIAAEIGLDVNRFKTDLDSEAVANIIERDDEDAMALQVRGTPAIFVNDQAVDDFRSLPEIVSSMI